VVDLLIVLDCVGSSQDKANPGVGQRHISETSGNETAVPSVPRRTRLRPICRIQWNFNQRRPDCQKSSRHLVG
jgi:hypothetical protein